ncbi:MAG: hypothetical protein RIT45_2415 [Pseudomonadota bacterium]|jgi:hypothetical protein
MRHIAIQRPSSTRFSSFPRFAACVLWLGLLAAAPAFAGGWESVGTIDGVRVWRKQVEGSKKLAFRGEVVRDVHIAKVLSVFADSKSRRYWVDRWKDDRELEVKNKLERTYWIRFGLPFPVSDRDYVLHTKAEVDSTKRIVIARIKSVQHKGKGVDDCCVRGEVTSTYYRFEAVPGSERTKLVVEVHTDPKGMLPSWLVNLIQKGWPAKTLNGLVRAAQRPTVTPNPSFVDWHKPPPPPAPAAEPAPPAPTPPAAPAQPAPQPGRPGN